jgi:hypothetical protein
VNAVLNWIYLAQDRDRWLSCECGIEPSGSIKCGIEPSGSIKCGDFF